MKKTAIISILLCLCMLASLVMIPMPQAAAANVDSTKLDGVWEARFFGDLMYTLTFDNGKLTIVDAPAAQMKPLAGEYTYTVVDGIPTVTATNFMFSKDPGGNYTMQREGIMMPLEMTKIAELGGSTTPDEPEVPGEIVSGEVTVTVTDNNCWVDEYIFTAPVAGKYTFILPAGFGMSNADESDGPEPWNATVYLDHQTNTKGGKFTIKLAANESLRFYVGATTKGDFTFTWTTAEVADEVVEVLVAVLGDNNVVVDDAAIAEGAVTYTFTVETAATYRFTSVGDALFVRIFSNGMPIGAGEQYLEPGTYTLVVVVGEETEAGEYVMTIATVDLDQEAADEVIGLIDAIGTVTKDSQAAIEAARTAYNALNDEAKAKVTNLATLEAAEGALAELNKPVEPTTPVTKPTTPATTPNGNTEEPGSPVVVIVIVVVVIDRIPAREFVEIQFTVCVRNIERKIGGIIEHRFCSGDISVRLRKRDGIACHTSFGILG